MLLFKWYLNPNCSLLMNTINFCMLTLFSEALLNSLLSSSTVFLVGMWILLAFLHRLSCCLQIIQPYFFSSIDIFISFSPYSVVRNSNLMLYRSSESIILALFLRSQHCLSPFSVLLGMVFHCCFLSDWESLLLFLVGWDNFVMNGC